MDTWADKVRENLVTSVLSAFAGGLAIWIKRRFRDVPKKDTAPTNGGVLGLEFARDAHQGMRAALDRATAEKKEEEIRADKLQSEVDELRSNLRDKSDELMNLKWKKDGEIIGLNREVTELKQRCHDLERRLFSKDNPAGGPSEK